MCLLSGIFIWKAFTPVALEALEVLRSGDHLEQAALGSSQASPTSHQEGRNRWGGKEERREKSICSGSPGPLGLSPSNRSKALCRSLTLCCHRALETCGDRCRRCWRRQRAQEHVWGSFTPVFAAPRRSELLLGALRREAAKLPPSAARSKKSPLFPRIYSRRASIPPSTTTLHPWILSCTLTSCRSPLPQHRKDKRKL